MGLGARPIWGLADTGMGQNGSNQVGPKRVGLKRVEPTWERRRQLSLENLKINQIKQGFRLFLLLE